jgi:hypothetical protein
MITLFCASRCALGITFGERLAELHRSISLRKCHVLQRRSSKRALQIRTLPVPSYNASYWQSGFLLLGCKALARIRGHHNAAQVSLPMTVPGLPWSFA